MKVQCNKFEKTVVLFINLDDYSSIYFDLNVIIQNYQ